MNNESKEGILTCLKLAYRVETISELLDLQSGVFDAAVGWMIYEYCQDKGYSYKTMMNHMEEAARYLMEIDTDADENIRK